MEGAGSKKAMYIQEPQDGDKQEQAKSRFVDFQRLIDGYSSCCKTERDGGTQTSIGQKRERKETDDKVCCRESCQSRMTGRGALKETKGRSSKEHWNRCGGDGCCGGCYRIKNDVEGTRGIPR